MTARPSSRAIRSYVRHEPRARRETVSSERPSAARGMPGSRSKPLDPPAAVAVRGVREPIVHATGPVLPELESLRDDAVAAPGVAEWHLAWRVAVGQLAGALLEPFAAGDRPALG